MDFDGLAWASKGFAAVHDSAAKAVCQFFRKLLGLVTAIDVDGLPRGVDDDLAVMTGAKMLFYFGQEGRVDLAIEVVGEFG
jgi:hypothetical protein